jgi:hypothetical protein
MMSRSTWMITLTCSVEIQGDTARDSCPQSKRSLPIKLSAHRYHLFTRTIPGFLTEFLLGRENQRKGYPDSRTRKKMMTEDPRPHFPWAPFILMLGTFIVLGNIARRKSTSHADKHMF